MKKIISSLLIGLSMLTFASKPIDISIIHINDHHSYLEPREDRLTINGEQFKFQFGGYSAVNQKINELRKKRKNPLVLHAGDAITGTLYFTLFGGSADAAVMNESKFDYFTLGNHEFDAGNEGLLKLLEPLKIPVLSSNVLPDKNSILYNKWKPFGIKTFNGEKVGIIGLDVVKKTIQSSSPGNDVKFYDEITTAQVMANTLKSMGINKIILLSHAGTEINLEIAKHVNDIDIIITGDSHYLYGNDDLRKLKLPVVHEYPVELKNPNGEPVFVVEAWSYSSVVGDLGVHFDKNGIASITRKIPHVLVHTDKILGKVDGKWTAIEGDKKKSILDHLKGIESISFAKNDSATDKILAKYKKEKDKLAKQVIGSISGSVMPGGSSNRIPGQKGASEQGSIATRFVAEVMLSQLDMVNFTIQNSGGVRTDINPGNISFNDAYTLLPFGNTLYTYKISGKDTKQVLEDALAFSLGGGSTGAFPYGANIRYEAYQIPNSKGMRLAKVEVFNKETKVWEEIKDDAYYIVGTNAYIASGKDGYATFGRLFKDHSAEGTDTFLPDAEGLISFMKKNPNFVSYTTSNVIFHNNKALPEVE